MSDLHSEEKLVAMAANMIIPVETLRNMTLIAVIKSDMAGSDSMRWRKHKQVLKDDGFDV